ncbi:hypothetical protein WIW50_15565 [Flavobacteriaceae bacterium 3-367]|uniref:exo-rhamnogalacturonan lyase family protein n=1 Tax=Eudoraea algarum TaxID=3417568 RepID=UPI003287FC30
MRKNILILLVFCYLKALAVTPKKVEITIDNNKEGAPITLGIPFPIGELGSIDNVRLLSKTGKEIACQTTEVSTWAPVDDSIKWIWVFFFSEASNDYILEYGEGIITKPPVKRIVSTNNMRPSGGINVNTGPLFFTINKKGNGFLDKVYLDLDGDGKFMEEELLASSEDNHRGTFLDILDDAGIDNSKAVINEVFREKGSGPMHTIFRIEGTYHYNKEDNNLSPFTVRLHAYADKSYIRVLHTLTYTGIPDKHKMQQGEHANIATQNSKILSEDTTNDPGWTQPNDRISGCGLTLKYHLSSDVQVTMPVTEGGWYDEKAQVKLQQYESLGTETCGVMQTGPERTIEEQFSSATTRTKAFEASIYKGGKMVKETQKAEGWTNISDGSKGISIGIKNFVKEYPKSLEIDPKDLTITGYIWPSKHGPMSFARKDTKPDGQMLDNFAQGTAKTTEFIYYFHKGNDTGEIKKTMDYVLKAPVAHASPEWYMGSKVYGNMAPVSKNWPEYENALQYKYHWWSYNQQWQPWYGMFNYGDGKTHYFGDKWFQWNNNEPTVDFMLWTNFMRTGDPKYYHLAQGMSRHTMDVDNIHWPKKRNYVGQINDAIDFWDYKDEPESTPYLGIGRRHAREHWHALLSAHVWIQGWIASYYLTADQRALEVAKMTGDTYIRHIWGDHDLRGRRLYLSVLNLVELYDATKLKKYKIELDERVATILALQQEQGGNLLLDRFGYSQTYVAQGLYKYYQITGNTEVKKALLTHARWVRDVPPLNHEMESYLATIYPLLIGYEFSHNPSFLQEAIERSEVLKVSDLPEKDTAFSNQKEYSEALLGVSNLPKSSKGFTNWEINQGLRVFGWTHAYNIPYLLYWLDEESGTQK